MRHFFLVLIVCLAGPGLAAAQFPVYPYVTGSVAFDFAQIPFGPYEGAFSAQGMSFYDGYSDPATFTESVGGFHVVTDDSTMASGYAATRNPDDTVDLFVWWIREAGVGLATGPHAVDLANMTTSFAFLDDISDFTPPVDFDAATLGDWIAAVEAEHVFVAASGSIVLSEIWWRVMEGTFSGTMADATFTLITVRNGGFHMSGPDVVNESVSWGALKSVYR